MDHFEGVGGQGEHDQGVDRVGDEVDISLDKGGGEVDEESGGDLASQGDVAEGGHPSQVGQLLCSSSDKEGGAGEDDLVEELAGGKGGEGAAPQ